jgi:hypothetical protein
LREPTKTTVQTSSLFAIIALNPQEDPRWMHP